MDTNKWCKKHPLEYEPCPWCRVAELEALVQMRTEANKYKQTRITELEGENTRLLHELSEAEQYACYTRHKTIDEVLALPRESAWEKPENKGGATVTPMWGVEVIRVSDIEALLR